MLEKKEGVSHKSQKALYYTPPIIMPKKVHWTPQQMEALFTTAINEKTYEHPHGKTKLAHELLTAKLASMAMFPDTLSAVAVGQQRSVRP